jgi:hypothetical protein
MSDIYPSIFEERIDATSATGELANHVVGADARSERQIVAGCMRGRVSAASALVTKISDVPPKRGDSK